MTPLSKAGAESMVTVGDPKTQTRIVTVCRLMTCLNVAHLLITIQYRKHLKDPVLPAIWIIQGLMMTQEARVVYS
jgi:hypothetical protein